MDRLLKRQMTIYDYSDPKEAISYATIFEKFVSFFLKRRKTTVE